MERWLIGFDAYPKLKLCPSDPGYSKTPPPEVNSLLNMTKLEVCKCPWPPPFEASCVRSKGFLLHPAAKERQKHGTSNEVFKLMNFSKWSLRRAGKRAAGFGALSAMGLVSPYPMTFKTGFHEAVLQKIIPDLFGTKLGKSPD